MRFSFLPFGTIKRSYQEKLVLASGPLRLTMRKMKIEALDDDDDPPRGDREVGIALIELGAIKKGKKARGHEWPAFVDTYRTLLTDPTPELMRLFERLPEISAG